MAARSTSAPAIAANPTHVASRAYSMMSCPSSSVSQRRHMFTVISVMERGLVTRVTRPLGLLDRQSLGRALTNSGTHVLEPLVVRRAERAGTGVGGERNERADER